VKNQLGRISDVVDGENCGPHPARRSASHRSLGRPQTPRTATPGHPNPARGADRQTGTPCLSFPIPAMGLGPRAPRRRWLEMSELCEPLEPIPAAAGLERVGGSVTRPGLPLFSSLLFLPLCVYI